ncbi:MAG: carbohydrate binding family 9 domain-containing protein, partial [Acidobacteriota bacterium]
MKTAAARELGPIQEIAGSRTDATCFRSVNTVRQIAPLALPILTAASFVAVLLSAHTLAQDEPYLGMREFRVSAAQIEEGRIEIDGILDEAEWELVEPASDFTQNEPLQGRPSTERTEVRVLYDDKNLYIGAYCFDSEGSSGLISKELKRDFSPRDSDVFQVVLDTFNDNRNGFVFGVNPRGAKRDMQVGGDGQSFNSEWDAIWHVRTMITDAGWQAEFAIPFRSLRFGPGEEQFWGINFDRRIRRKSEVAQWAPVPQPYFAYRVSLAGSLNGVSDVRQGRNLYVKPYLSAPIVRGENDDVDFKPDAGLDVKYGLTSGLTLDLTLNTDFSQVEADDAQINFSRFSLFFPEKREFFLENRDIFDFGSTGVRTGGRRRRGGLSRPGNDLVPFFSRRIGIEDERLVPILGGGRVTGRAGPYRLGFISMQTARFEEIPSTNFTIARLRRDVFQSSDIGVIFVNKNEAGDDFNRTYGVDANFRFFDYLEV